MNRHAGLTGLIGVLIFLVLVPLAILDGQTGWLPELFVFMGLTVFYVWTYKMFRMNLPILTMLIIAHLLHAMGIFGWYHASPLPIQWDHVTHFFGALPFALLFFRFFGQWMDVKIFTRKNLLLLLAVFLAATGVGAVVEMAEFIGYLTLGFGDGAFQFGAGDGLNTDLIDDIGGGWINTGYDFIFNTIGIIFGMVLMLVVKLFKK